MVNFEVSCYYKDDANKIIGAEVTAYNSNDNVIDRILITDNHGLEELRSKLDNLNNTYVNVDEFKTALADAVFRGERVEIDATLFDGKDSSKYCLTEHTHTGVYAPYSHQSNNDVYGAGTTDKYGHVKIRDNLNATNLVIGEALSSRQGNTLYQLINDLTSRVSELETSNELLLEDSYNKSTKIKIGKWSDNSGEDDMSISVGYKADGLYAKIYSDKPDYSLKNKEVIFAINNIPYPRSTDATGKTGKVNINLEKGEYFISAYVKEDGVISSAVVMKKLVVV